MPSPNSGNGQSHSSGSPVNTGAQSAIELMKKNVADAVAKAKAENAARAAVAAATARAGGQQYGSADAAEQSHWAATQPNWTNDAGHQSNSAIDAYIYANSKINADSTMNPNTDPSAALAAASQYGGIGSGSGGSKGRGGGGGGSSAAALASVLAALQAAKTGALGPYDSMQALLDKAHADSAATINRAGAQQFQMIGQAAANTQADHVRTRGVLDQLQGQTDATRQGDLNKAMTDIQAQGGSTASLQGHYAALQSAAAQHAAAQKALTARLDGASTDSLNMQQGGAAQQQLGATQSLEQQYAGLLNSLAAKRAATESDFNAQIAKAGG